MLLKTPIRTNRFHLNFSRSIEHKYREVRIVIDLNKSLLFVKSFCLTLLSTDDVRLLVVDSPETP